MQDSFSLPHHNTHTTFQWHDTGLHKLMLSVFLARLENQLLLGDSATRTLENWCRHQKLAPDPVIKAIRLDVPARACPQKLRDHLQLHSEDNHTTLRYRRVCLTCGPLTLSHAENWYRPDRLTGQMNTVLETTDAPFGRVTTSLAFSRQTLEAEKLWDPLPGLTAKTPIPGGHKTPLDIAPFLFRHHAILKREDNIPFSAVIETYTADLLRFTPPDIV